MNVGSTLRNQVSGYVIILHHARAFPGRHIPDWPRLLHLYSRLKPGTTVREWMESYEVHKMGLDVRRFTSFGVIKVSPFFPSI